MGDDEVLFETGKLAMQAGGAVTATLGETVVLATATMSKSVREGMSFFPLSVDYEEKLYAAGRIPGSFFRREGRPAESAILTARVIDRCLRPLFPKDLRNEVQIILYALSHDQEHQVDMLGIAAASAALMISDIPWDGPVGGARIGMIGDEFVVNPTFSQMQQSILDLRVAGTSEAINMVECGAVEVDEETMLRALQLGHESIQPIIAIQNEMREQLGKPKAEYPAHVVEEALQAEVSERVSPQLRQILVENTDRNARSEAIKVFQEEVVAEYEKRNAELAEDEQINLGDVKEAFDEAFKKIVRHRILHEGVRPDGRDFVTIRPLSAEVDVLPRVHGTGLFQRGETQVLTVATLGTPRDSQELDGLAPEENKRYLHHYNFPPFSTGETWFLRGPKRREIGHGALAETALRSMIPDEKDFPYTIRLVSEVLSSNGSTSMASVCGSTLALMDAGVPIVRPVAGIAMGLISDDDQVAILTDIQGMEDHLGDMDFKVAGTSEGITALQMDIKIAGLSPEVMAQALSQARDARMQILEVITNTIPKPREQLKDYAPRMTTLKIDPQKIGAVIGPGGKIVRSIQERTGVTVDIQEDGTVFVAGSDGPSVEIAVEEIRSLTEDPEVGRIYTGKVTRIEPFGAFVEFLPGRDGMVHISQLADYRVSSVEDEVSIGDEIMVMVTNIEHDGKVRLSRQAVLEGWSAEEARQHDRPTGGGGRGRGERRGNDRRGGNRGGSRRGNDRRGGNRGGNRNM
ncbi:MAG: polyribonucleotide nucleotidyltransferase [Chloroflexi bacterium]|nr:MAG: polyribonucleotide nucleotidyltransferase [Chloroflexota bacterium]